MVREAVLQKINGEVREFLHSDQEAYRTLVRLAKQPHYLGRNELTPDAMRDLSVRGLINWRNAAECTSKPRYEISLYGHQVLNEIRSGQTVARRA